MTETKDKTGFAGVVELLSRVTRPCTRVWYLIKNRIYLSYLHRKNKEIITQLRAKAQERKLKVAFLVVFDSVFPAQKIFELMRTSELFSPTIVVIPDTLRGHDNLHKNMQKTYAYLKKLYGDDVVLSYDMETREFIDLIDGFDICCPANPYDGMTYRYYRTERIRQHNILMFYINYGYPTVKYARNVFSRKELSYVWRYYIESNELVEEYKKHSLICAKNTVVIGYCKMDALALYGGHELSTRKKIIIAPHHTVKKIANIFLSNFLELADFFQELPKLYPQVDFVFRPHPLLFTTLRGAEFWGDDKVEAYVKAMQANINVEYQNGGDYFETFATADAMIHDCSSFVTEWMYTGKPGCYILKNKDVIKEQFVRFGENILEHYYHAFTRQDIIEFIDSVVLRGNDPKRVARNLFFDKYIKVNYPSASAKVIDDLTAAIKGN